MFNRKPTTPKIDETVARSVNFEITIADIARRSERRAWWVAFGAIAMALILAGGYFYMLPLKQKVPYLVMADAYTGTSTVARLTDVALLHRITTSDAINRSNVAHYILARESYDVTLLNLRDWVAVLTMSAPGVAASFRHLYASNNPDNPYKTYGRTRSIRIKILSIVLLGGGRGQTPTGATVRFQRSIYDKQDGSTHPLDNKIATLTFAYKPNLKMSERDRIANPLGFQVTDFRVDNDYDSTPPAATRAQSQGPMAMQNASAQPRAATPALPGSSTQPPIPEHAAAVPGRPGTAVAPGQPVNGVGRR